MEEVKGIWGARGREESEGNLGSTGMGRRVKGIWGARSREEVAPEDCVL